MKVTIKQKRTAWLSAVAALAVASGSGSVLAADLGGNCCADLEERIAELEATTARKGNRKVSLEISGHVNQTILAWDDGFERNVGVYTNDNSRTRFRFTGKAKINGDWEAGYRIEIGVRSANSKRFNQDDPTGSGTDIGFDLRDSFWFVKSKTYGAVSVGLQASATDAITEINQTQTESFSKFSDVEDSGLGLFLRGTNGAKSGESWRRLIGVGGDQPGEGERKFNQVKYVSPEFAGFAVSAAWGEDDFWDVALRYKGEFAGLKVAAGIGYGALTDGVTTNTVCAANVPIGAGLGSDVSCDQFGGSVSVIHDATGLFINAGGGEKTDDLLNDSPLFTGLNADNKQTFWALQAGIEKKWFELGKTTLYGEYYDYEGGATTRRLATGDALTPAGFADRAAVWSSGIQSYGFGAAQGFDAAALVLYVNWRHYEADLTVIDSPGGAGVAGSQTAIDLEDLDVFQAGGIIKF